MHFESHKDITKIKDQWIKLQPEDGFYQSYEFNLLCYRYRIFSITGRLTNSTECDFVVGIENGEPVCIAPLVIDQGEEEKVVHFLGHGTNAGMLNFIYKEERFVGEMYEYCVKKYEKFKLQFIFVSENSPLKKYMDVEKVFENYAINVSEYDVYFSSLSKSTRQNIRTAYNRVNSDAILFEVKEYDCSYKKLNSLIRDVNVVYQKRRNTWNGSKKKNNILKSLIIEKRDVVFQSLRKLSNARMYVLYLAGEIACFLICYEQGKRMLIPRLAINEDYARYSPGYMLINEIIKMKAMPGFVFDLGRGEESYKKKLNGDVSYTYTLINKK